MLDFIKQNVPQNGKADWENEAKQWRLPYWDFARFARHGHDNTQGDELRLPILVTMPMVKVVVPGQPGKQLSKPNPLYRFQMQTLMGTLERPYAITSQKTEEHGWSFDLPVGFTNPYSLVLILTLVSVRQMPVHHQVWSSGKLQRRRLGGRWPELAAG